MSNWIDHDGPAFVGPNSLRDWFAGMAMQALITSELGFQPHNAGDAYEFADAMIKARDADHG